MLPSSFYHAQKDVMEIAQPSQWLNEDSEIHHLKILQVPLGPSVPVNSTFINAVWSHRVSPRVALAMWNPPQCQGRLRSWSVVEVWRNFASNIQWTFTLLYPFTWTHYHAAAPSSSRSKTTCLFRRMFASFKYQWLLNTFFKYLNRVVFCDILMCFCIMNNLSHSIPNSSTWKAQDKSQTPYDLMSWSFSSASRE